MNWKMWIVQGSLLSNFFGSLFLFVSLQVAPGIGTEFSAAGKFKTAVIKLNNPCLMKAGWVLLISGFLGQMVANYLIKSK